MKVFTILKNIINRAKTYTDDAFGQMGDYVVEQGTSGNWKYRKWNSGISEAWYGASVTLSLTTAWGSLYFSGSNTNFSIPSGVFNSTPTVQTTVGNNSHMMGMSLTTGTSASNVHGYIWASRSEANLSIMVRLYCFGTWK